MLSYGSMPYFLYAAPTLGPRPPPNPTTTNYPPIRPTTHPPTHPPTRPPAHPPTRAPPHPTRTRTRTRTHIHHHHTTRHQQQQHAHTYADVAPRLGAGDHCNPHPVATWHRAVVWLSTSRSRGAPTRAPADALKDCACARPPSQMGTHVGHRQSQLFGLVIAQLKST